MRHYVRAANIRWNGWSLDDVKKMNFDDMEFAHFHLRHGDVLINEGSGSAKEVGKPAVWREEIHDCCFQNTLLRVRPNSTAPEYLYLYFLFCARTGRFVPSTQGVNIFHIGKAGLAKFPVPVPPLPEQRRIVTKIENLSSKSKRAREQLDHIPRLAEKYKQAVLSAAIQGNLTRDWRRQRQRPFPATAQLDNLVEVPIRNGLSVRGSDQPPGIRSLRLSALRTGNVDLADVRYLPIPTEKAERFLIRNGDVLISRGNGTKSLVGLAALVGEVADPTIFPDTAFRVRLDRRKARASWLRYIWRSREVRRQIEDAAKTTAGIWKIAQSDLHRIGLPLPELDEQDELTKRIERAFLWIDTLSAETESARNLIARLDQTILAKALRGELVPQDPNDESVSAMLDKISA